RTIKTPIEQIYSVAFSPDSQRIAACGWGMGMVWDTLDSGAGREPITLHGFGSPMSSLAFSPDGKRIVTGSFDGAAKVWEAATGREVLTLYGHRRGINSVAFSPHGKRIVTGSHDRTALVWDAATEEQVTAWDAEESQSR
ncbi:MAG TPA: hypothetical protein VGR78_12520, partial [Verrucomicrobiae bacterium]|nr:hypothetical protein [Verrucomicrobiae bacterium]